jgi:2'-5' RNA ligase
MPEQLSFDGFEPSPERLHNVYFAMRPPPDMAQKIFERSRRFRDGRKLAGRLTSANRLHISLCGVGEYLGNLPACNVSEARAVAESMMAAPIIVEFDQLQTFQGRKNGRPIVLSAAGGLPQLSAFQRRLGSAMARGGMRNGLKSSFNPHLTLMYCERVIEAHPIEPVRWTANEFFLIDSLVGRSLHIALGRWPLRG